MKTCFAQDQAKYQTGWSLPGNCPLDKINFQAVESQQAQAETVLSSVWKWDWISIYPGKREKYLTGLFHY